MRLGLNAVVSNTRFLLRAASVFGLLFGFFAAILAAHTVYNKFSGVALDGFTTVILFMTLQASVLFLCLGVLGEYVLRVYSEVKPRPKFIIEKHV